MRKPFFENNRVALYCGDSLEVLDELAAEGKRFDLFLTDPPYGLNQANKKPSGINAERAKGAYEGNLFVDDENYLHNVVRKVLEKSLKMCDLGILTGGRLLEICTAAAGGRVYVHAFVPRIQYVGAFGLSADLVLRQAEWEHREVQDSFAHGDGARLQQGAPVQ